MTAVIVRGRGGVSIRALMISVALCALILAPFVWMYRRAQAERQQLVMAALDAARAQADNARLALLSDPAAFNAPPLVPANPPREVGPQADRGSNLWAALSVNHPLFEQGQTKDLKIEFTLVNDGDTSIDPKIADSVIVINGQELAESSVILGGGPKDGRFQLLPPGAHVQLSRALGDHCNKPGVYRVSWKGDGFQSPEIVIRVVPEKPNELR
jgi:type II secretory pathway pseudopilin PulG